MESNKRKKEEIAFNLRRFIKSMVKLALFYGILKVAGWIVGFVEFDLGFVSFSSTIVFKWAEVAVVIYYGSYILRSSFFFLDIVSGAVTEALGLNEPKLPRRIGMDIIYIIGLVLAYEALIPFIAGFSSNFSRGKLIVSFAEVAFFFVGAAIVYDIGKSVYYVFF